MGSSAVDRLHEENILDRGKLTDDQQAHINQLTGEEVDALVKMKAKLGHPPDDHDHIKPNVFV